MEKLNYRIKYQIVQPKVMILTEVGAISGYAMPTLYFRFSIDFLINLWY